MDRSTPVRFRNLGRIMAASVMLPILVAISTVGASAQSPTVTGCASDWADGAGLVWVVFCSDVDGLGDLYEREPDGDVRRLTYMGVPIGVAALTPDGSTVVFEATDPTGQVTQIYSIKRAGDRPAQLTSEGLNRDPILDPSGGGIVFVSDRDGVPTLWSMKTDGSDQRPLFLASAD
jgi:tricorn protease-like protein